MIFKGAFALRLLFTIRKILKKSLGLELKTTVELLSQAVCLYKLSSCPFRCHSLIELLSQHWCHSPHWNWPLLLASCLLSLTVWHQCINKLQFCCYQHMKIFQNILLWMIRYCHFWTLAWYFSFHSGHLYSDMKLSHSHQSEFVCAARSFSLTPTELTLPKNWFNISQIFF